MREVVRGGPSSNYDNQVVYLRPDQQWQAGSDPGETSHGEKPKSFWQRLWPW